MRRNLRHQPAIAIALAYIEENKPFQALIVMGQDGPQDVLRLIEKYRAERSESWIFHDRLIFYLYGSD